MHLLANTFANILFFAGLAIAAGVLLRRFWKYQRVLKRNKKKKSAPLIKRIETSHKSADRPLYDAPVETLRWQVELEERSREITATLDSKMAALQSLIALATAERERLDQAVQKAAALTPEELRGKGYDALAGIVEMPVPSFPETIGDDKRQAVYSRADQGHSIAKIANLTGLARGDIELILSSRASS